MAARDILTLKTPMAEGIIRLLYTIALDLDYHRRCLRHWRAAS